MKHFYVSSKDEAEGMLEVQEKSKLYQATVGMMGVFWSTVLAVEFMDIVFSIDNIFAVVAYTNNIFISSLSCITAQHIVAPRLLVLVSFSFS